MCLPMLSKGGREACMNEQDAPDKTQTEEVEAGPGESGGSKALFEYAGMWSGKPKPIWS